MRIQFLQKRPCHKRSHAFYWSWATINCNHKWISPICIRCMSEIAGLLSPAQGWRKATQTRSTKVNITERGYWWGYLKTWPIKQDPCISWSWLCEIHWNGREQNGVSYVSKANALKRKAVDVKNYIKKMEETLCMLQEKTK